MGAAVDTVEDENGPVDAGLSKLDSFFRQGNTEAIHALRLKPSGNWNHAVPVCIRLDDCEDLPPGRRALYNTKVVPDRVEQNLGARRS